MTQEFYSIVTEKGLEKQIKCLNDLTNFDISYIAVGDSNGSAYTPQETQTTLKNEKWRGAVLFHGIEDGKLLTNGGRVLGVTAVADDLKSAIAKAYGNVPKVTFENAYLNNKEHDPW